MENSSENHVSIDTKSYFENVAGWPMSRLSVAYMTGFILSIIFTLVAYFLATYPSSHSSILFTFSLPIVTSILAVLAFAQFIAQLFFFFHFGSKGEAARERLWILIFTLAIVTILVSGSLWIMFTLNARMMPSETQMEQYMNEQTGI